MYNTMRLLGAYAGKFGADLQRVEQMAAMSRACCIMTHDSTMTF